MTNTAYSITVDQYRIRNCQLVNVVVYGIINFLTLKKINAFKKLKPKYNKTNVMALKRPTFNSLFFIVE